MADQPKTAKASQRTTVRWNNVHTFEERIMRHVDWVRWGATAPEEGDPTPGATVWNQENSWTVNRKSIPLDDAQLEEFLSSEGKFTLSTQG